MKYMILVDMKRNPAPAGRDILTSRIAVYREAFAKREGIGSRAGIPLTEADMHRVEEASKITWDEHFAFQNTQAWAHASGIISPVEARVIYAALGEVGSDANGGWASGTDLATKVVVQQILGELLGMKLGR